MEARDIVKLYYSIGEVSDITNLKQYVLRYWESEFPQLAPTKNRAGNRIYKAQDVDLVMLIKNLLYDRKFTIKGAKQYLKDNRQAIEIEKNDSKKNKVLDFGNIKSAPSYMKISKKLNEIINLIDQYKD
tara:strand:- start:1033 stop:1419 length:387 start_codon:yes stop_codon:yes gene_type:complete